MPRHIEKAVLPYTPQQVFDLVADIQHYPDFLPWCLHTRILSRQENGCLATMTVGFGPFKETFTSRVTWDRPHSITVQYERGPFKHLNNHWIFSQDPHGCLVDFSVDFEFESRILRAAIGMVFSEATRMMVSAFKRRAKSIYK